MLIDARTLPDEHLISTEICVIGTGPAGITVAREFAKSNTQVCVLESGGLDVNPQAQALSEGETFGDPFLSPQLTRHRQFGGNSNIWAIKIGNKQMGVRYAPLDEIDFEHRDWVPHSGWCFSKAHLDPFYERAQQICQSGPYWYDADSWESEEAKRLPLEGDRIVTSMFQFGARDVFCQQYRDELIQTETITVYVNATVVDIETDPVAKTATRVRAASVPNRYVWVEAKVFILAQGGMENARLLLLSNQQQSVGLGNQHDWVGRGFMDHPLVNGGMFVPADPEWFNRMALYDLRQVNGSPVLAKLAVSQEVMRREELLNTAVILFPRPRLRQMEAIATFKNLVTSILAGEVPADTLKRLAKIMVGVDYVFLAGFLAVMKHQSMLHGFGRGGWSELPNNQRRFQSFQMFFQTEQAPDPENRIQLSRDRDPFGRQKLELHWRWREIDSRSVVRTQDIFAEEICRSGLGEFQIDRDPDGQPNVCRPSGLAHHIGTTRMHHNPRQGVVDENCRVHGLSNLFIAGSSVFPTGGYANPTLTIVALSLRLADHLKQVLQQQMVYL